MKIEFSERFTGPHKKLFKILKEMGFQPKNNEKFDSYEVDIVCDDLPSYGFEADGKLYHSWRRKDKSRDEFLFSKFGIRILRIPESLLDGRSDEQVKNLVTRFISENEEKE